MHETLLPECTRIGFSHEAARKTLLANGWREIEVLETWQGPAPRLEPSEFPTVRRALPEDEAALCRIAVSAFKFDRLHVDPEIPKALADEAKRKWVRDAMKDPERTIEVALGDGPIGLLIWKGTRLSRRNAIIIDLLAVDPSMARRGVARQLVATAANSSGFRVMRAGTQAVNEPARKFYKSLGMKPISYARTFHR